MSTLVINRRRVESVMILDMTGGIRLGETNAYLHETIKKLVNEGEKKILLNLAEVTKIDSSGMGELIAAWTTLQKNGGEIRLLNLTQGVEQLMLLTKLLTVFDTYENEPDAVMSFRTRATDPLDEKVQENAAVSFS
jgi:anti-sigma B factor antagonist